MIKKYFNTQGQLIVFILLVGTLKVAGQKNNLVSPEVEKARTDAYEKQLENYLRHYLVEEYEERAAKAWNRDYSSADALERSVKPNRRRWEEVLSPPLLRKSGIPAFRQGKNMLFLITTNFLGQLTVNEIMKFFTVPFLR